jgi:hypothetical protein
VDRRLRVEGIGRGGNDACSGENVGHGIFGAGDVGREVEAVEAVERAPGVTNHWLAFAHALVLTGRYDDARESLLNALALDPGNETATKALADLEKLGIGGEGGEAKKGEQ